MNVLLKVKPKADIKKLDQKILGTKRPQLILIQDKAIRQARTYFSKLPSHRFCPDLRKLVRCQFQFQFSSIFFCCSGCEVASRGWRWRMGCVFRACLDWNIYKKKHFKNFEQIYNIILMIKKRLKLLIKCFEHLYTFKTDQNTIYLGVYSNTCWVFRGLRNLRSGPSDSAIGSNSRLCCCCSSGPSPCSLPTSSKWNLLSGVRRSSCRR